MLVLTMLLVLEKTSLPGMSLLGRQECENGGARGVLFRVI